MPRRLAAAAPNTAAKVSSQKKKNHNTSRPPFFTNPRTGSNSNNNNNNKLPRISRRLGAGLVVSIVILLTQALGFWTPNLSIISSNNTEKGQTVSSSSSASSSAVVVPLSTSNDEPAAARVQEPWGSYSRFLGNCPLNEAQALHFVVLSDRTEDSKVPLLAMVNSLLFHCRSPVVLHVVSSIDIDWLLELDRPYLQINIYRPQPLMESSLQLMKTSNFSTSHYSGPFAMQKLFLADLPYPPGVRKVLMLDDDYLFLSDPTPLVNEVLLADVHQLNLHCPRDGWRVGFHSGTHYQGRNRYCISGIMGLPVQKRTTELFVNATFLIMKDYPNFKSKYADQDVVNRVLYAYPDQYSLIPCYWSCDINSCKEGFDKKCRNCDLPQHGETCKAVHFLNKAYKTKLPFDVREENSWDYYFNANTKDLVLDFEKRVAGQLPCA